MRPPTSSTTNKIDDQLAPLVRNLLKGITIIVTLVVVLKRLQVDITAVIGGVAFGTLAFALAAQDTIKNLFGSVVIFLDRPFKIGDWIVIGDSEGVVEEVSIRSTRIRTFANSLISIPNGNIAAAAVNNMGARVYRRFVTRVALHFNTPTDLVELYVEGLREIVRNHPGTRKEAFEIHFDNITDSSLQVMIYVYFEVPTWTQELEGRQSLLICALELAKRQGILFAADKTATASPMGPDGSDPAKSGQYLERARVATAAYIKEFTEKIGSAKQRTEQVIEGSDVNSDQG